MSHELEPCPFCDWHPSEDLADVLYPSGIRWGEIDGMRFYQPGPSRLLGQCYIVHCTENMGGCGAVMSGDSREEAIAKWNRRADKP